MTEKAELCSQAFPASSFYTARDHKPETEKAQPRSQAFPASSFYTEEGDEAKIGWDKPLIKLAKVVYYFS